MVMNLSFNDYGIYVKHKTTSQMYIIDDWDYNEDDEAVAICYPIKNFDNLVDNEQLGAPSDIFDGRGYELITLSNLKANYTEVGSTEETDNHKEAIAILQELLDTNIDLREWRSEMQGTIEAVIKESGVTSKNDKNR